MEEFKDLKPNSHRYREASPEEKRKIEKVLSGNVKTRKKSEITKFANVFISDDVKNVKQFLVMDILVPTIKKAILSTVDMILNGGNSTYTDRRSTSKVSYRKYYDDPRDRHTASETRVRPRFDYDDIVFETRGEAEAVLEEMLNVVDRWGFITVGDMYDMVDLPQPYTSNKYGWMNLANSDVVRLNSGGYILKLPKAAPID